MGHNIRTNSKRDRDKTISTRANGRTYRSDKRPDHLEEKHLLDTLGDYDRNAFVAFLLNLFPDETAAVWDAIKDYRIGTKQDYCVFPVIKRSGRFCKAKLIKYDRNTGKRVSTDKDPSSISSLEHFLKRDGSINDDFEKDKEVFFGEHLLSKYPGLPVGVVESEKTAVICSIEKGVFPEMVWLACGSGSWLNAARLRKIGPNRKVWLFPDADSKGKWIEKWRQIAKEAKGHGMHVIVSDIIEKNATEEELKAGSDIADYLIRWRENRIFEKKILTNQNENLTTENKN
ncbi:MAG: hypothetical protein KF881_01640 [Acidobacteria bacterium]|nr:hypothetical protein [Acidobacteriota bacterium]